MLVCWKEMLIGQNTTVQYAIYVILYRMYTRVVAQLKL